MTTPLLHRTLEKTVDDTTTTVTFPLPQFFGGTKLHFGNISSLTGTLSVSFDGGTTFTDWLSLAVADGTKYDAGDTVTCVDDMDLAFEALGATHVKFTRTGGSGPVSLVCSFAGDAGTLSVLRALLNSASALDTNIVKHNGTEYQVTRVGGALTATGSLVPATSAKYGVLLYLLLIPEDGVDDTFRLSDSGGDLLGTSAVPIPLSSDGGAAGASGFGFNFPYGIKTTGVNRAITITFGGAGTFAYYAVYALTTD